MEPASSIKHIKIEPTDVFDVLESRKFVDNILDGMLHDIKNSPAYIDLKEIAIHHFASIEASKNDEPIERKKKQTYDVGYLSDCVASTLTKTVHEKLIVLKDEIYAASKDVIKELELKNSNNVKIRNQSSSSKKKESHVMYTSTPNKRNRKRGFEANSDTDVSPLKKSSKQQKKLKSKDYSENVSTSVTDYCPDASEIEKIAKTIKIEEI